MPQPLKKGIEVECWLGRQDGRLAAIATSVVPHLPDLAYETDRRQIEYRTPPLYDIDPLLVETVAPRLLLREFLAEAGDYTILPGSTPWLPFDDQVILTSADNRHQQAMSRRYGPALLACGAHLHVGWEDQEALVGLWNAVRTEAYVFLALSASSPFRNGQATGFHSSRWQLLPKEPANLPLIQNHAEYLRVLEAAVATGELTSLEHLWAAARLNGPQRPYDVNRIELRICDVPANPAVLVALTAFLEARVLVRAESAPATATQLAESQVNEAHVAKASLDAVIWQQGREVPVRTVIASMMAEAAPLMQALGTADQLAILEGILAEGNDAMRLISRVEATGDLAMATREAIDASLALDSKLASGFERAD